MKNQTLTSNMNTFQQDSALVDHEKPDNNAFQQDSALVDHEKSDTNE